MSTAKRHRAKERIRELLKRRGPLTAAVLADELAVTAMAVRQHLYKLAEDGEVAYDDVRRSVGRPSRHWRLTRGSDRHFPDSHGELAVGLIDAMEQAFGAEGLRKLVDVRSQHQLETYRDRVSTSAPVAERVEQLAQVRTEEGYMAECSTEPGGEVQLVENNCPICVAAQRCPGLCAGELNLFRLLLGDDVSVERTEHILGGERRCVYRIAEAGE